jgi:hypothetical protein
VTAALVERLGYVRQPNHGDIKGLLAENARGPVDDSAPPLIAKAGYWLSARVAMICIERVGRQQDEKRVADISHRNEILNLISLAAGQAQYSNCLVYNRLRTFPARPPGAMVDAESIEP